MSRLKDAYRDTALYEQVKSKGGDLSEIDQLIGDDLSDEMLDDLWAMIAEGKRDTYMASWWEDKPHQIMYRLLLRLTRSEDMRCPNGCEGGGAKICPKCTTYL